MGASLLKVSPAYRVWAEVRAPWGELPPQALYVALASLPILEKRRHFRDLIEALNIDIPFLPPRRGNTPLPAPSVIVLDGSETPNSTTLPPTQPSISSICIDDDDDVREDESGTGESGEAKDDDDDDGDGDGANFSGFPRLEQGAAQKKQKLKGRVYRVAGKFVFTQKQFDHLDLSQAKEIVAYADKHNPRGPVGAFLSKARKVIKDIEDDEVLSEAAGFNTASSTPSTPSCARQCCISPDGVDNCLCECHGSANASARAEVTAFNTSTTTPSAAPAPPENTRATATATSVAHPPIAPPIASTLSTAVEIAPKASPRASDNPDTDGEGGWRTVTRYPLRNKIRNAAESLLSGLADRVRGGGAAGSQ